MGHYHYERIFYKHYSANLVLIIYCYPVADSYLK